MTYPSSVINAWTTNVLRSEAWPIISWTPSPKGHVTGEGGKAAQKLMMGRPYQSTQHRGLSQPRLTPEKNSTVCGQENKSGVIFYKNKKTWNTPKILLRICEWHQTTRSWLGGHRKELLEVALGLIAHVAVQRQDQGSAG